MGKQSQKNRHRRRHTTNGPYESRISTPSNSWDLPPYVRSDWNHRNTMDGMYDGVMRTPAGQIRDRPPLIRTEERPGRLLDRQDQVRPGFCMDRQPFLQKGESNGRPWPSGKTNAPSSWQGVPDDSSSSTSSEEISLSTQQQRTKSAFSKIKSPVQTASQSLATKQVPVTVEGLQAEIITLKQTAKEAAEKAYAAEILVDVYRNRWLALKTHLA